MSRLSNEKFEMVKFYLDKGYNKDRIAKISELKLETIEAIEQSASVDEVQKIQMDKMRSVNWKYNSNKKENDTKDRLEDIYTLVYGFNRENVGALCEMGDILKEIKTKGIKAEYNPPLMLLENVKRLVETLLIINNKLGEIMDKVSEMADKWQ